MKRILLSVVLLCSGCVRSTAVEVATAPPVVTQETQENDFSYSDVLYARTTLHGQYADTAIETSLIEKIVEAGFSAPTGGNQRSLEFYVVTEKDLLESISAIPGYFSGVKSAPLAIVVCGNANKAYYSELEEMDSGLAAMAMIVAATDQGLSTCVMSIFPQEERIFGIRQILNMADELQPILLVTFGYPSADAITSASVYNNDPSRIHWNRSE